MSKIFELRQKRAVRQAELNAIVSKEADLPLDESLGDDEATRFTALETEIKTLDARIARLESIVAPEVTEDSIDSEEKAFSAPFAKQFQPAHTVYAQVAVPVEKGLRAARWLIGKAVANQDGARAAAEFVSKSFADDVVAKTLMSVSGTGSTTIPTTFSSEIIELLRPQVAVRTLNPQVIGLDTGNVTIPRLSGGATATWSLEAVDITESNETIDTVTLGAKKLTSLVPVSNSLLRRSPIGIDALVRQDLIAQIARKEDLAFISGDGTGGSPVGIKNFAGINSFYAAGIDATSVVAAINGARVKLQLANARMQAPGWIMNPNTVAFISSIRDGVGGFLFKNELDQSRLLGYPVATSTQIPSNYTMYGSGGTAGVSKGTDIFLVDFADILLGQTFSVDVTSSTEASYLKGGTTLTSAFSQDLTLFRVITEVDINTRHPLSTVLLKADNWVLV